MDSRRIGLRNKDSSPVIVKLEEDALRANASLDDPEEVDGTDLLLPFCCVVSFSTCIFDAPKSIVVWQEKANNQAVNSSE